MKNLDDLKERLLALPGIREGRQYEARYAAFLEKSVSAKEKLEKASAAVGYAGAILPAVGHKDALRTIKTSSNIALRLRERLEAEAGAVVESNTEERFNRLFENASTALKSCQTSWESELHSKIKDWESIQDVVAKLMPAQGARLKRAIDSLEAVKKNLPLTEKATAAAKGDLENLKDSVAKLDLKGPFGEFLRATVSDVGADLTLLQNDEVSKVIAKHKLQKVFRVHVSV